MVLLWLIGLTAGLVAGISPCILPVLPVIVLSWTVPVNAANPVRARRRRAFSVALGLALSFAIIETAGLTIIRVLHLPDQILNVAGAVLLALFGLSLMFSPLAHLLERPFRRLTIKPPSNSSSGFIVGLALGAVFTPCAGPVLTAIAVIGQKGMETFSSVVLTFAFALGAVTPMLVVALAGDRVVARSQKLRERAPQLRVFAGVLLIVMALGTQIFWITGGGSFVPSYTSALQHDVENNSFAVTHLRSLQYPGAAGASVNQHGARDGDHPGVATAALVNCENTAAENGTSGALANCGAAPRFAGIVNWINTSGKALNWTSLKGHVVLIDFWTYSCINCQRTLPHVEAWYQRYHRDGLVVVGVHSPEFAFEHVVGNVRSAVKGFGLTYPVAVDSNLDTWSAYENEYWPAEYLVDANGNVQHVDYGEGNYGETESDIRALLIRHDPTLALPSRTDVPDRTPTAELSPETYLGDQRSQYLSTGTVTPGWSTYTLSTVASQTYGLGGRWDTFGEYIRAGTNATLELNFTADDVYLVMGGTGQVTVSVGGKTTVLHVSGYPRLYQLVRDRHLTSGLLHLSFSPGVEAYDFTFG